MKKVLLTLALALTMTFGFAGLAHADPTADAKAQVCQGISTQAGGTCGTGSDSLGKTLKAVIKILSTVAGIAAIIMVIVSGLRYITSAGDANAVSGAKKTLVYAIVGLIIVAISQFIVHFVLGNL